MNNLKFAQEEAVRFYSRVAPVLRAGIKKFRKKKGIESVPAIDVPLSQNQELLFDVISYNDEQSVIKILNTIDDVNYIDERGLSPLSLALGFGQDRYAIVNRLLERGADPNKKIILLRFNKDKNVMEWWWDKKSTPLLSAITAAQPGIELIKLLLEKGSDPNKSVVEYVTIEGNKVLIRHIPLLSAVTVQNPNMEIIDMLLDYGADPYAKDNRGRTALDIALASNASIEIIDRLQRAIKQ